MQKRSSKREGRWARTGGLMGSKHLHVKGNLHLLADTPWQDNVGEEEEEEPPLHSEQVSEI